VVFVFIVTAKSYSTIECGSPFFLNKGKENETLVNKKASLQGKCLFLLKTYPINFFNKNQPFTEMIKPSFLLTKENNQNCTIPGERKCSELAAYGQKIHAASREWKFKNPPRLLRVRMGLVFQPFFLARGSSISLPFP
jgi:hypothetical protein